MTNLQRRAEDYEQRLRRAGSTDELMVGLVKAVRRTQLVTKMLASGIVAVVFLALIGIGVAVKVQQNSNQISELFQTSEQARYLGCLEAVAIIEKYNAGNRALIKVEQRTKYADPVDQDFSKRRIAALTNAIISPVFTCGVPK
ncbi:MAG TPA: hypothetical protein VGP44_06915 [Gemmatimonadales bacterium]|nr:hypothetical protein [Gemmatimonadales bacterium]